MPTKRFPLISINALSLLGFLTVPSATSLISAGSMTASPKPSPHGIAWASSFAAAAAQARTTRKLVMVDLYTDWCGWCKQLDADTYTNPRVIALSHRFVPVKVNAEKEGVKLAAQYHVDGYPTILFLDAHGRVVKKIDGYEDAGPFAKDMASVSAAPDRVAHRR